MLPSIVWLRLAADGQDGSTRPNGFLGENDPVLTRVCVAVVVAGLACWAGFRVYRWWVSRHSGWCRCGHLRSAHEHYRRGSDCGICGCPRFQAQRRPALVATAAGRTLAAVRRDCG